MPTKPQIYELTPVTKLNDITEDAKKYPRELTEEELKTQTYFINHYGEMNYVKNFKNLVVDLNYREESDKLQKRGGVRKGIILRTATAQLI